jgi:hypothetical protein
MQIRRRQFAAWALGAPLLQQLSPASQAAAQPWPVQALTVVVPFAPGGSVDVAARLAMPRLAERLGHQDPLTFPPRELAQLAPLAARSSAVQANAKAIRASSLKQGAANRKLSAALLAVPEEVLEAAHAEGASGLRIFWQIKLPLIYPTLGLVTILTFVANFNAFDLIYSVKGALAGPNYASDLPGTYFYRTFFGYQAQIGSPTMGAAVATLMFLVILAGVGAYFVMVQRRLTRYAL